MRLRALSRSDDHGSLVPSRRELAVFAGYVVAAGVYIGIGLYSVDFLLSYWVAVAYVLVTVWLVPTLVRKFL